MSRESRGVLLRSMQQGTNRAGRAGGKEGKRALGPRARDAVAAAHDAAASGDHAAAAEAFASLSTIANERGLAAPSTFFACQAGLAHVAAGKASDALEAARAGIAHGEAAPEKRRLARPFTRLHKALQGLDADAASTLSAEVRERFGLKSLPAVGDGATPNRAQRRSLPKACACCGAATSALELRFEADGTLDCPRCGDAIG